MTQVKCSVANCHYWAEGNKCSAQEIMVEIDPHATRNFNEEFGEMGGTAHQDLARTSSTTCCQTFIPKSKA